MLVDSLSRTPCPFWSAAMPRGVNKRALHEHIGTETHGEVTQCEALAYRQRPCRTAATAVGFGCRVALLVGIQTACTLTFHLVASSHVIFPRHMRGTLLLRTLSICLTHHRIHKWNRTTLYVLERTPRSRRSRAHGAHSNERNADGVTRSRPISRASHGRSLSEEGWGNGTLTVKRHIVQGIHIQSTPTRPGAT